MRLADPFFRDTYLAFDRRTLGAFRIFFGLILLFDLGRRVPEHARLYSNAGVLSNHALLFMPQAEPQLSFFFAFSTPAEVAFAFGLTGVVYLFYTIGLYTRLMQVLAFALLASLNARNLFFEDGGVATLLLLAAWTLFLPLADRYSLDALRAEAPLTVSERVQRRRRLAAPLFSAAKLWLALQAAAIYALNAAHKTGTTWRQGDAVHLVLWQNRVNTELAAWIARHEPSWLSPAASFATIRTESLLPLLLLSPWLRKETRLAAFALALALHVGIALIMTLGPFSYAMLALVFLQLPPELFGDWLKRKHLRARLALPFGRWCARAEAGLQRAGLGREENRGLPSAIGRSLTWLREGVLGVLLLASLFQLSISNRAVPRALRAPPRLLASLIAYPRLLQSWSMFAPDAPLEDGTLVVDARTAQGSHIDPFTAAPPDFDLTRHGPVPHRALLSDYLFAMQFDDNRRYRRELSRYLKAWVPPGSAREKDPVVAFRVFWVKHRSPERGSSKPGPAERRLLFKSP